MRLRNLYLTETSLCVVALVMGASVAFAHSPVNDPRAEVFRYAGCDAEGLKPVLAKDGVTVLYWQNTDGKGCPTGNGGMDPGHSAYKVSAPVITPPSDDEEPVTEEPEEDDDPVAEEPKEDDGYHSTPCK